LFRLPAGVELRGDRSHISDVGVAGVPIPTSSPVRFGSFELDLRSGELRKDGLKIRLADQPLHVLTLLLEHPGAVVTREELQRRLWSADTFVEFEHSLNAAVKRLREALGDSAINPIYIETLPRHGYRLIIPVDGPHNGETQTGTGPEVYSAEHGDRPAQVSNSGIIAIGKHGRWRIASGALVVLALVGAAWLGVHSLLNRVARFPFQTTTLSRVTFGGDTWASAISPDGKYLATLRRDSAGRDSLWMYHLPTNSNTQVIPPGDVLIADITFSPDGDYVYYRLRRPGTWLFDLYRVPVLGGTSTLITHDVDSRPSFSIGARRFCFMRYNVKENSQVLLSANSDGTGEKLIYSGTGSTYFDPAWSPDGTKILVHELIASVRGVGLIDAGTGRASHFASLPDPAFDPASFAWMPDGSGFIVFDRDTALGPRQIAYMSYPRGEFHRITNDLSLYGPVSVSADGKALSTVLSPMEFRFEVFPAQTGTFTPSSSTSLDPVYWFDWIGNDQLVLTSLGGKSLELLSMNAPKRTPLLSTNDMLIYDVVACGPRAVVFTGLPKDKNSGTHVYALELSGGTPRQLTSGKLDQYERCTPDGKWVIYYSFEDHAIHKIAFEGGQPQVLVSADQHPFWVFSITPDGKQLVVKWSPVGIPERPEFAFISLQTGQPIREIPALADACCAIVTPDAQHIAFLRHLGGVDNIWLQPTNGSAPFAMTDFRLSHSINQEIAPFAWSADGRFLAIRFKVSKSDAIIIRREE
jgi:DNA-binding winged helix-turn-helix (wHTH) protein/Tol biopolymer transport system component